MLAELNRPALDQALQDVRRETLKPATKLSLMDWAEKNRFLSRESSAEPGRWKTSRVPVAAAPMAAFNDPYTHTISVMCCTQLMKTEFLLNIIGYTAHEDPKPILFVTPTKDLAESISKERIDPMFRDSPALKGLIARSTSRLHNTTIFHKPFPGGALNIVGANSPTELSSRPVGTVVSDEIDKFPESSGKEGDAIKLAEERTAKWWNRKHIRACSPTDEATSKIWREYQASDQRKCFLTCPHCHHDQFLTWQHVHWSKDDAGEHLPNAALIHCEECGSAWTEKQRRKAIDAIMKASDYGYRQTAEFSCCGEKHDPKEVRLWSDEGRSLCPVCEIPSTYAGHAGFTASKLYDKIVHLPDLVRKFLDAKRANSPNVLKTFVNTQLAEVFTYQEGKIDAKTLFDRREIYQEGQVPRGVNFLTVGADVQGDRIECELIGWGKDAESWSIDYQVFDGDPNSPTPWNQLDRYLMRNWEREDGRYLMVQAACVDTGGTATQTAYQFCNERLKRRIWPIKGRGMMTNGDRAPIWPLTKGKDRNRQNANLILVGVDAAKDQILSMMRTTEGPGAMHFPADRDLWWFEHLTAERRMRGEHRGRPVLVWEIIPGRANEGLDCRVYGLAALQGLITRHKWKTSKDYSMASPGKLSRKKSVQRKNEKARRKGSWLNPNGNWLS